MLVRYFQELQHPSFAVEAALTRDPHSWLPKIAQATNGHSMDLVARVGLNVGPTRLEREVVLTISAPHHLGDTAVIPIAWEPIAGKAVLPTLEGDLEVSPMGDGLTQLAISARYQPPLGWAGEVAERALMRRVAEATVKDFLDGVAAGIEAILDQESKARQVG